MPEARIVTVEKSDADEKLVTKVTATESWM